MVWVLCVWGQAPAKKATLEEVLNRKEEDESLEKYKAALLGGAAAAISMLLLLLFIVHKRTVAASTASTAHVGCAEMLRPGRTNAMLLPSRCLCRQG